MKIMENRKTAMQELFDNLQAIDITVPIGVKEIFLEKEKRQIIDIVEKSRATGLTAEYLLLTYESKGSETKQ
jgi:glycosylphosphatidylinositol transamidase (GPIT) subunit GPI8